MHGRTPQVLLREPLGIGLGDLASKTLYKGRLEQRKIGVIPLGSY
jgi:hypothetical protein